MSQKTNEDLNGWDDDGSNNTPTENPIRKEYFENNNAKNVNAVPTQSQEENGNDDFENENADDEYDQEENANDQIVEPEEDEEEYPDEDDEIPTRMSRHKRHPILHVLKKVFFWVLLIGLLGVVSGIGLFAYYAQAAPNVTQDQLQSAGSSSLYTSDGKLLLNLSSNKRYYLHYDKIPQTLINAVTSVEDKHFYQEHLGIDPLRIAVAAVRNMKGDDISSGASTITQQLVKLSVFSTNASNRNLRRKAQEAWLAMKITHEFSKQQILEYYVNKVYMNYGNYGMGTAAIYYYGKPINKLDLAQTALIAGMPNSPTTYNPYIFPKYAEWRRNLVLQAMLNNNKITKRQYYQATQENIQHGLVNVHPTQNKLRHIDDPYIKEAINEVERDGFNPYNDNLKITVNIDQQAQSKLYELANDGKVPFTNKKMQAAATIVDPNNGHVVAILGGRHLPNNVQLGLDRAVETDRSTGSSIKPILDYAPAIEYKDWSTAQILADTPYIYAGTHIQLFDWDNQYLGNMTMRYALEQSRNVPAVRTLQAVGMDRAIKFVKPMGIHVHKSQGLSVAIGANASTLQMAGAFSALDDYGVYHKPHFVSKIEAPDGLTRYYDNTGERVMKNSTAYMITDMLKGVISNGSGEKAMIPRLHEAGKTGTVKYADAEIKKYPSYRNTPKDSWFVGYTRSYVMSVWTGYDKLSDGKIDRTGENSAMLLYKNMMSYLMKDKDNFDWIMPKTVVAKEFWNGSATTRELYVKGYQPKVKKNKAKKGTRSVSKGSSEHVDQTAPIVRHYNTDDSGGNNSSEERRTETVHNTPSGNREIVRTNRSPNSNNSNRGQTRQQNSTNQPQTRQSKSNSGGIKTYVDH